MPQLRECTTGRFDVPERFREFELSVGDVLQIGEHTVTVVDIDGTDVSFRIDSETDDASECEFDLGFRISVPGK